MATKSIEQKRAARAAYMQKWRAENPGKWKAIAGKARAKWKANNRDAHRECQRAHRADVRLQILELLGGARCRKCGFDDVHALQIDHINGGGCHDRDTFGGNANLWSLRNKLQDTAFRKEARRRYQVLCANCNWIKRVRRKEHAVKKDAL